MITREEFRRSHHHQGPVGTSDENILIAIGQYTTGWIMRKYRQHLAVHACVYEAIKETAKKQHFSVAHAPITVRPRKKKDVRLKTEMPSNEVQEEEGGSPLTLRC